MYANFQSAYYEKNPEPLLNKVDFIKYLALISDNRQETKGYKRFKWDGEHHGYRRSQ